MLTDDLSGFNGKTVAPSLRGDNLLCPDDDLKKTLTERTDITITDIESYIKAVCVLLDEFHKAGCRFADHALDAGFFENNKAGAEMLCRLGTEYAKRNWTLLLHIDAKRATSARLAAIAGYGNLPPQYERPGAFGCSARLFLPGQCGVQGPVRTGLVV